MADQSIAGKLEIVEFHGDTLLAIDLPGEGIFVVVKPIVERLGLRWNGQLERIKRDRILVEGMRVIRLPVLGMTQEAVCLRLDLVHGWLFSIDDRRVRPELQDLVLTYRRECYTALYRHFCPNAARDATGRRVIDISDRATEVYKERRALVDSGRLCFGERFACQLWIELGLPVPSNFQPLRPDQGELPL